MSDWKGMNQKVTPVWPDSALATYAQGMRLKIDGEMQRRPGLAASTLPKLSGAITAMWAGGDYGNYAVTQVGGTVTGDRSPNVQWAEIRLIPPTVIKGNAAAPVIVSIDPTPLNGPYPVGQVSFLATIVYDGLSGALTYSWTNFQVAPGAPPNQIVSNANPGIFDFTVASFPGLYSYAGIGGLTVTTAFNGFSTTLAPSDYTVV